MTSTIPSVSSAREKLLMCPSNNSCLMETTRIDRAYYLEGRKVAFAYERGYPASEHFKGIPSTIDTVAQATFDPEKVFGHTIYKDWNQSPPIYVREIPSHLAEKIEKLCQRQTIFQATYKPKSLFEILSQCRTLADEGLFDDVEKCEAAYENSLSPEDKKENAERDAIEEEQRATAAEFDALVASFQINTNYTID